MEVLSGMGAANHINSNDHPFHSRKQEKQIKLTADICEQSECDNSHWHPLVQKLDFWILGSRRRPQQVDSAGYGLDGWYIFFLFNRSSEKNIIKNVLFWHNNFTLMRAHLRTFKASTLCPLADDLSPAAGAELAARVVPYVTVVTHRTLVEAAPLGSHALLAALTSAFDFSLTLQWRLRLSWGQLCFCSQIWLLKVTKRSTVTNRVFVSACICLFQTCSNGFAHFFNQQGAGFY